LERADRKTSSNKTGGEREKVRERYKEGERERAFFSISFKDIKNPS
jgi:hypothetical protein